MDRNVAKELWTKLGWQFERQSALFVLQGVKADRARHMTAKEVLQEIMVDMMREAFYLGLEHGYAMGEYVRKDEEGGHVDSK